MFDVVVRFPILRIYDCVGIALRRLSPVLAAPRLIAVEGKLERAGEDRLRRGRSGAV